MALLFAIAGTQGKSPLYPLDVKTALWHIPYAIEKVDYTRIGYEIWNSFAISVTDIFDDVELLTHLQLIHEDIFAISVTDICDDIELETHLQLIHEEFPAPKSSTIWWCKKRKSIHLVR